jgi:maleylacetoacetate isomerase
VKLYGYFRSSAAYRVRIALNLKDLPHAMESIHLTKDGGRQHSAAFHTINPHERVPALVLSGGETLTQSVAILEYLDEIYPDPPLLPADAIKRAQVRAFAQLIACDIHPLNNLAPLQYLKGTLGQAQDVIDTWYRHWVTTGFEALEKMAQPGPYAFGSQVTMADVCLAPQIFNAQRFKVSMDKYPKLAAIDAACNKLAAFAAARPENQPDAE